MKLHHGWYSEKAEEQQGYGLYLGEDRKSHVKCTQLTETDSPPQCEDDEVYVGRVGPLLMDVKPFGPDDYKTELHHGWYSEKAKEEHGSEPYTTEDGRKVECTHVTLLDTPPQRWDDEVYVGQVQMMVFCDEE